MRVYAKVCLYLLSALNLLLLGACGSDNSSTDTSASATDTSASAVSSISNNSATVTSNTHSTSITFVPSQSVATDIRNMLKTNSYPQPVANLPIVSNKTQALSQSNLHTNTNTANTVISVTQPSKPPVASAIFCSTSNCNAGSTIKNLNLTTNTSTTAKTIVYVYNNGTLNLNNLNIKYPTNAVGLSIANNTCAGITLLQNSSCNFEMNYAPSALLQPTTSTISINYSTGNPKYLEPVIQIPLTYACIEPNIVAQATPDIPAAIDELDMNWIQPEKPATLQTDTGFQAGSLMPYPLSGTIYLVNTGKAAATQINLPKSLNVPGLEYTGCTGLAELASGAYCAITITYDPISPATIALKTATFQINYTDGLGKNYNSNFDVSTYSRDNIAISTTTNSNFNSNSGSSSNAPSWNAPQALYLSGISPNYGNSKVYNYFYFTNFNNASSQNNYYLVNQQSDANGLQMGGSGSIIFGVYPYVTGMSLISSANSGSPSDYTSTVNYCDSSNLKSTCWQGIQAQYSGDSYGSPSGTSNLQAICYKCDSTGKNILISTPINYNYSFGLAQFVFNNNSIYYILTDELYSYPNLTANEGIGIMNIGTTPITITSITAPSQPNITFTCNGSSLAMLFSGNYCSITPSNNAYDLQAEYQYQDQNGQTKTVTIYANYQ